MNTVGSFSLARLPRIEFGSGAFEKTAPLIRQYGRRVLIVTGARSFVESSNWPRLTDSLTMHQLQWWHCTIAGEPSPGQIDDLVTKYSAADVDVVVGIGGGSALDAAKAIAGLLRLRCSVTDFLEGVGPERQYPGPSVPFIAVPTTAGTGSEATKNAVLSRQGEQGYKKSFRDEALVARVAIVDPDLLAACPPPVIAANGMDALTQLLESYVSLKAGAFTDALAESGLRAVRDSLLDWYRQGPSATAARAGMAYAALLSGITLAQVGLGSVHGLASPLGAFFPIPHGVVCGTLVAAATAVNVAAMREREPDNRARQRYARVAEIFHQRHFRQTENGEEALVDLLQQWTEELQLTGLSRYGVETGALDKIVRHARGSSMKTNPIVLSDGEIRQILQRCL